MPKCIAVDTGLDKTVPAGILKLLRHDPPHLNIAAPITGLLTIPHATWYSRLIESAKEAKRMIITVKALMEAPWCARVDSSDSDRQQRSAGSGI